MAKQKAIGDDSEAASTNKLLRVIVALMLRPKDERSLSLKQQIAVLHDLGLRPAEIAVILGRTNTHINKELSGIRKSRREK